MSWRLFILAETSIDKNGIRDYLDHVGASDYETDISNSSEYLIEIAGKACYKSYNTKTNSNLTQVTKNNNQKYIANLINQKHYSVLGHGNVTVAFVDVSRIFTHELVRHHVGMVYSQESGRYCVQDINNCHLSSVILEDKKSLDGIQSYLKEVEISYNKLSEVLTSRYQEILGNKQGFHFKKTLTSFLRRFQLGGGRTTIIATGNHIAWRHIFNMRTGEEVEEEMREIMKDLLVLFKVRYKNIYGDFD